MYENDNDDGHQEEDNTEKFYDFLFSLGKAVMKDVQPNVRVMDNTVGNPDHDADAIKVPLQLFKHHQAFPKNVSENNLQDDHHDQDAIEPRCGFSDTVYEFVQCFTKLWYLFGFFTHVYPPSDQGRYSFVCLSGKLEAPNSALSRVRRLSK